MVYDIGVAPSTPVKPNVGDGGLADDLTEPLVMSPLSSTTSSSQKSPQCSAGRGTTGNFCYPKASFKYGPFFDADTTLEISPNVARGYLVLLTGGAMAVPKVKKPRTKVVARLSSSGKKVAANDDCSSIGGGSAMSSTGHPGGDEEGQEVELTHEEAESADEDEACRSGDLEKKQSEHENGANSNKAAPQSSSSQRLSKVNPVTRQESALLEKNPNLAVAFMSLTDGNVIDACFGVKAHNSRLFKGPSHGARAARNAKEMLREASESHDAVRLLAVEAYGRCFEIVMGYHRSLEANGVLGWCWKAKKIREEAVKSLVEAFEYLTGAVESSL